MYYYGILLCSLLCRLNFSFCQSFCRSLIRWFLSVGLFKLNIRLSKSWLDIFGPGFSQVSNQAWFFFEIFQVWSPPSLFLSSGRCYHPHTDRVQIQTSFYKSKILDIKVSKNPHRDITIPLRQHLTHTKIHHHFPTIHSGLIFFS